MDVVNNIEIINYHNDFIKYKTPIGFNLDGSIQYLEEGTMLEDSCNLNFKITAYYENGICHRDNNKPAVIINNKTYIYVNHNMITKIEYNN